MTRRRSDGTGRRTQRHKMNRWQRAAALAVTFLTLAAVGSYLYVQFGTPARPKLTTTPTCLQQRESFCTGIALKAISKKDLAEFTSSTGVFPALVEYYQKFGTSFSQASAVQVAQVGARPFIQLNPHNVSIAGIASGQYDKYLKSYAEDVRRFGHAVVLSFGHEMNGTWSTWSEPFTRPAVFVAAWRHIVTVFRAEHAKNVTWAWDVSHAAKNPTPWWPGGKYADWVGIDGYLRPGQTFAGQFYRQLKVVRKAAGHKPVLITETAVAPGPKQVKGIQALFEGAKKYHFFGLIWFDVNKQEPWQLKANSAALAAFKKEAQSS